MEDNWAPHAVNFDPLGAANSWHRLMPGLTDVGRYVTTCCEISNYVFLCHVAERRTMYMRICQKERRMQRRQSLTGKARWRKNRDLKALLKYVVILFMQELICYRICLLMEIFYKIQGRPRWNLFGHMNACLMHLFKIKQNIWEVIIV